MDSDDSDFYGDAETVSSLRTRVETFDVDAWLRVHSLNPGRPQRRKLDPAEVSHLHNPYAGVSYAWQLTETVENFLDRLPPATTNQNLELPWIVICNPYIPRVSKQDGDNQSIKGSEDEAPVELGSQVQMVAEAGLERLDLARKFVEGLSKTKTNKKQSTIERDIRAERKKALDDILDLAHAAKVRAGKWMLFCTPGEVNEIWEIVAKATANNELGVAAKVAPRHQDEDPRKDRLLCVYTADFKDKVDVARVVNRLRELKLVDRNRAIFYKPDAFTYIGISHGNSWGVKASIYCSTDVFKKERGFSNVNI